MFRSDCLWRVSWNDVCNDCLDGRQVLTSCFPQFTKLLKEDFFIQCNRLADMDHFILSIGKTFFIHEDFFVKLFTRSQTSEFDFDVFIRNKAGHADHVPGEVEDLHRLAHVEDEDLAAFGVGTGLKDKTYRFWNRHEEADDVRMCDRDRTTGFDLLFKERNNRAVRTKNVAKADRYK